MVRLQQRRTRLIAIAMILVCAVVFHLYHRSPDPKREVTWRIPHRISTTTRVLGVQLPKSTEVSQSESGHLRNAADTTLSSIVRTPSKPAATNSLYAAPSLLTLPSSKAAIPSSLAVADSLHTAPLLTNLSLPSASSSTAVPRCIGYEQLQRSRHGPLSAGKRQFPYSRPPPECRTFNLTSMERLIERMNGTIKDPDLFRLFENSYPNTLDTMIRWHGYATEIDYVTKNETVTDQELTYVITGDINAMWLRDSASQIYSYFPLLEPSPDMDSLASVWRGVINIQARYIVISPYCHSFQPPPESGVPPTTNGAYRHNHPNPPYDPLFVFDCKWELDSLASFLQISVAYYQRTNDLAFFDKYNWVSAVEAAVDAAGAMRLGTYSKEGKVQKSAWTFTGWTNRGSETLTNDGLGNPIKENGMVRTAFRPSDDACIYQFLVPANMMWAKYLEEASFIMENLDDERAQNLTIAMREFAYGIRKGIDRDATVHHRDFGDIFAYEIDGYGGLNLMDDANIPSLLSIPLFNYTHSSFPLPPPDEGKEPKDYNLIYRNTRKFALSDANPYMMRGPVLSAIGGPHLGPGKGWPMAAIVTALTALSPSVYEGAAREEVREEVNEQLRMVLDSTSGTGVVHESVNAWSESDWSRAWFGWANGLLGELVIKLAEADEAAESYGSGWLVQSFQ